MHSGPSHQSRLNVDVPRAPQCLAVESRGVRVPADDFDASVHSVFDSACNLRVGNGLVTLVGPGAGRDAATVRLARDLRFCDVLDSGERLVCRNGRLRGARLTVALRDSPVWSMPPLPIPLPQRELHIHLMHAGARLVQHRRLRPGVLDHEAAPTAAALQAACAALDPAQARQHALRLVGWGEGLTPSGDDFLAGLLAGLDSRPCAERRSFRDTLARAIQGELGRTTPISAHLLGLAVDGHFGEPMCLLRNGLIGESDLRRVAAALDCALAVGASSGADSVSGLLAGLQSCWNAAPVLH